VAFTGLLQAVEANRRARLLVLAADRTRAPWPGGTGQGRLFSGTGGTAFNVFASAYLLTRLSELPHYVDRPTMEFDDLRNVEEDPKAFAPTSENSRRPYRQIEAELTALATQMQAPGDHRVPLREESDPDSGQCSDPRVCSQWKWSVTRHTGQGRLCVWVRENCPCMITSGPACAAARVFGSAIQRKGSIGALQGRTLPAVNLGLVRKQSRSARTAPWVSGFRSFFTYQMTGQGLFATTLRKLSVIWRVAPPPPKIR